MKRKNLLILWIVCCSLSMLVFAGKALDTFEWKAFDRFSRALNPAQGPDSLVVVQIDQESVDALSRMGNQWPWPRQIYAPLVEYMAAADAVFIDLIYSEPSSYGVQDDEIFAAAVGAAGNVYLPLFLTNKKDVLNPEDEIFLREKAALPGLPPSGTEYRSAVTPIKPLRKNIRGAGNANVTLPPEHDGVYRIIPLVAQVENLAVPQFMLGPLLRKNILAIQNGMLLNRGEEISRVENGVLIRFFTNEKPFTTLSAAEVLQAYLDSAAREKPQLSKDFFRGKTVFIGPTAAGLYDLKPTPTVAVSTGILINATLYENLLTKSYFRPVPPAILMLAIALLSAAMIVLVVRFYSIALNIGGFLVLLAFATALPAALFTNGYYMPILYAPFSVFVSFAFAVAYSYATEGKERRFIKSTFSHYMDKTLVEYVLQNPRLIRPGGDRHTVTIFFSDMAGFTALSEQLDPQALALLLHRAHTAFTGVIIRNGGVIDKYIGDAVMAFWGAPLKRQDDEARACAAALECMEALAALNRELAREGKSSLAVRIGLHTGEAIVGNMGSEQVFAFTAVGDTVNLASRLEGANKYLGSKILISESTALAAGDDFLVRELGLIEVKGKKIPVRIFELLAKKETAAPETLALASAYSEAYEQMRAGKIDAACSALAELVANYPEDGPSQFHKTRCERFREYPSLTDGALHITMSDK